MQDSPPRCRPAAAFSPAAAGGPFARPGRRLGKPRETVGRKATELRCREETPDTMFAGLQV